MHKIMLTLSLIVLVGMTGCGSGGGQATEPESPQFSGETVDYKGHDISVEGVQELMRTTGMTEEEAMAFIDQAIAENEEKQGQQ